MKNVSLNKALKTAVKAAKAAGRLMRANWYLPKRVKVADAHDIKLELDVRSQKLIEKILRKAFPQIPLLGEEGDSGNVNAGYRWVVDPIDGTVNYFFGMPHAAVSIALQSRLKTKNSKFKTLLGVIYDPFTDELWTVTLDEPTRLNGRAVRVSKRAKLGDAIVAMGFSKSKINLNKSLPYLSRISRRVLKVRIMGSAALELAYIASGRLDAYIERTINLWDIAAGGLMVERSGGEFYTQPAPGGKLRMVASNGLLRRKLQIGNLLK
jgi:myo-inositol-1(or 4)-monophosphatase